MNKLNIQRLFYTSITHSLPGSCLHHRDDLWMTILIHKKLWFLVEPTCKINYKNRTISMQYLYWWAQKKRDLLPTIINSQSIITLISAILKSVGQWANRGALLLLFWLTYSREPWPQQLRWLHPTVKSWQYQGLWDHWPLSGNSAEIPAAPGLARVGRVCKA